jgi:putative transposase
MGRHLGRIFSAQNVAYPLLENVNWGMNTYYPKIHHRKSLRFKGVDYSQEGIYFLTICTHKKKRIFGQINFQGQMELSEGGQMADACWREIPNHFPNVALHAYVIMPDHVHGLIEIKKKYIPAHLIDETNSGQLPKPHIAKFQEPTPGSVGSIVKGFKIGVTKWFRMQTTIKDVWQRNYYVKIVRDDMAFYNISQYIKKNPSKWKR